MMKKQITLILIIFSSYAFSQTHSIDQVFINLTDDCNVSDFYGNTFYNAYDTLDISWQIIESTMPSQWSFSNCFPNCYNPGVTYGTNNFLPNSQQYLNCHFYPNNTAGTGIVKMEIVTNQQFIDTVTWIGVATSSASIDEGLYDPKSNSELMIFDVTGKRIDDFLINKLNIVIYDDGKVEKFIKYE